MMINRLTNCGIGDTILSDERVQRFFYLLPKTRASSRQAENKNLLRFFIAERSPFFLYDLMPGFLKLPHDVFNLKLKPLELIFYIYLLHKHNQFGNKDFYLTDKIVCQDLLISQTTLWRYRKSLKNKRLIDYTSGKWEKIATTYHIKSISNLNTEHFKLKPSRKIKSISNLNPNKEVSKKELNKDNFIPSSPPENWSRDTIRSLN